MFKIEVPKEGSNMRDPLTPDCAVEGCYYPMTQWDIYCEGHDYLTIVIRSDKSKEF